MTEQLPLRSVRGRASRWPTTTAIAVAASLALAGCGSDTSASSSSATSTSSSAASATGTLSAAGTSSTSGATAAASASSGGNPSTTADVVTLAQAFAATLGDDQRAALNQEYTFANASDWSNLPNALLAGRGGGPGGGTSTSTGRVGLQTDSLTDEQWAALKALLAAATGTGQNEGYDEVLQHLAADDYLADNGGGEEYGRGNYFIAFLGTPSATGTWELQFGGHHLAIANTYTDGQLAGATPSFRGIEPMSTVAQDGITVQPEQQEQQVFAALLGSLDSTQAATAKLSTSFNDILLGPGKDWAFPTSYEGIAGAALTDQQKALLLAAIKTYVDDVDDADAAAILAKYESELDQTYVSYSGSTAMDSIGDYIRIDGPSVWIEFSMQHGIVLSGAHPHAVWRDKQTDYAGLTS